MRLLALSLAEVGPSRAGLCPGPAPGHRWGSAAGRCGVVGSLEPLLSSGTRLRAEKHNGACFWLGSSEAATTPISES